MARVAKEKNVVTQMGNQGHSGEGTRRVVEWVQAGVVGPIREAHIYTNRPVNFWAQGLPRLFLGPAPEVPYHPVYHPFSWRGWVDYGGGALGDMGAHLVDQAYWALNLEYPTSIVASSTAWGLETIERPRPDGSIERIRRPVSYPLATTAEYQFPARGSMPPVQMFWYDSGILPPRSPHVPDDFIPPGEGGGFLIGEKGTIFWETYGNNARVYPESLSQQAQAIAATIPRVDGNANGHERNWANACKGEGKAVASFDYSAKLVETMLLGVVALRAGQGKKIIYDGPNMKITNAPDANQYLTREYRKGWEL
jgi:hypothetical protein